MIKSLGRIAPPLLVQTFVELSVENLYELEIIWICEFRRSGHPRTLPDTSL